MNHCSKKHPCQRRISRWPSPRGIPAPWGPLVTRVGLLPPGFWVAQQPSKPFSASLSSCFSASLSSCLEQKSPRNPSMGSGFFGKRQIWPQVGVHKLFISHPVDSDSPLIVVCIGGGGGGISPAGRQETPDTAGHSVFLTCMNGLTIHTAVIPAVWPFSLLLFRIYMRFAFRSTLIPCTRQPLTLSL